MKSRFLAGTSEVEFDAPLPNGRDVDIRATVAGRSMCFEATVITESDENQGVWARFMAVKATDDGAVLIGPGEHDPAAADAGEDFDPKGLVLARPDGEPIHPEHITRTFDRLVAKHGLTRIRFHDLRHTHATLLLKAGVPVKVVFERLGHASPGFTLNVYQHVLPGMQAEAARIFDNFLGGPASVSDDEEAGEEEEEEEEAGEGQSA